MKGVADVCRCPKASRWSRIDVGGAAGPQGAEGRLGRPRRRGARQRRAVGASTGKLPRSRARRTQGRRRREAIASAPTHVDAVYEFPYLAHATMEPMNCVGRAARRGARDLVGPSSSRPSITRRGQGAGLPPEKVKLHTLVSGGSFGRRANYQADYVVEAVHRGEGDRRRRRRCAASRRAKTTSRGGLLSADVRARGAGRARRRKAGSSAGSTRSSASRSGHVRSSRSW